MTNLLNKVCTLVAGILLCLTLVPTNHVVSQTTVTVFDGSTESKQPADVYWEYTWNQMIILQSEINQNGLITAIQFEWDGFSSYSSENWEIWMAHTTKTSFDNTTDWVSTASMYQVFDNTFNIPASAGFFQIDLDTDFGYNNTENLIIGVKRKTGTELSSSAEFYSVTGKTNRTLQDESISDISTTSPGTGTLVDELPSLKLVVETTNTWDGSTSTDWNTASNWSLNSVPTSGESVIIPDVSNDPVMGDFNAYCYDLTLQSGATLTHPSSTKTLYIYGDVVINGTITQTGGSYIRLEGTNKTLSGTGTQTSAKYYFLNSHTLNESWSIDDIQTFDPGTLTVSSGYTLTLADGLYNRSNCTITLDGTASLVAGGICWFAHEAGSVFTVNSGTLDLNVTDAFLTGTGGTFNANSATINITGLVSSDGTFNAGTSTVELDGSSNQDIIGSSTTTFHDLIINNSSGDVDLTVDAGVSGTLTMTDGNLIIPTGVTLTLSDNDDPGISGGSTTSHIQTSGTALVVKSYTSTTKITFPFGDGTNYRPISLTPAGTGATTWSMSYIASSHSDLDVDGSGLDHVSEIEYWNCNRSGASPENAVMELTWHSNSAVNDYTQLEIAHYDGTTDWDLIDSTPVGTNSSGTITTDAAVSSFSPFTLGSRTADNPLPVELIDFSSQCVNHSPVIQWSTANEVNHDFFELLSSEDGLHFIHADYFDSPLSMNINQYEYRPIDMYSDKYYSLRQYDMNGEYTTYGPIQVNCNPENDHSKIISVFASPSNHQINILFEAKSDQPYILQLYTIHGQLLHQLEFSGYEQQQLLHLPQEALAKGVYFIRISDGQEVLSKKFVIDF